MAITNGKLVINRHILDKEISIIRSQKPLFALTDAILGKLNIFVT